MVWEWEDWYFDGMSIKELSKELKRDFKINEKKSRFILDVWGDFRAGKLNMGEFKDFVNDVLSGQDYYGP